MSKLSLAKGHKWEWIVCRRLSVWWTQGETDAALVPTRASGALPIYLQQGDVSPVSHNADCFIRRYLFECKHVKPVSWAGIVYGTVSKVELLKFYKQACRASNRYGQLPIVVFKENMRKPCFMWCRSTRCDWFGVFLRSERRKPPVPLARVRDFVFDDFECVLKSSFPNLDALEI